LPRKKVRRLRSGTVVWDHHSGSERDKTDPTSPAMLGAKEPVTADACAIVLGDWISVCASDVDADHDSDREAYSHVGDF